MKLSQILGIEKTTKAESAAALREATDKLKRPDMFSGFTRTYLPTEEGGEQLPPERKVVQARVSDVLAQVESALAELWDIQATKDAANQQAVADVVIDGVTLLAAVPATTLLQLEKNLVALFEDLKAIPVLDPSLEWKLDSETELYRTPPQTQTRTKKVPKVITLAPATAEHPAQAQLVHEDVPVGAWSGVAHSGAMAPSARRDMLARIGTLVKAVTAAREEANGVSAPAKYVGKKIFGYVLHGKI